jgi:hypothetical protein
VLAGLVVFLATVIQSPARFVWDAATYWAGSVSLAQGRDPYVAGLLNLRGVLTPVLYLPAALATKVVGESAASVAVLVENSLLVALVGALLLPWLLRAWVHVTPWMVWVCAGLTWLLVGRFAPYPLVDLWAVALMLAAVVALQRHTAAGLTGAGLLAGMAFNVRPAYLLPLLLALVVVLLSQRLAGLWFAAGIVVALLPQSIANLTQGAGWRPWPHDMFALTQLQAYNASFVVRYDTARLPHLDPRQFFCSPSMAQAVGDHPPVSTGELAALYLHNLPQSAIFVAEKAAAAVHWPLSVPYLAPTGVGDQMFAFLVTMVTVLGAVSLVRAQAQSAGGLRSVPVAVWVAVVVWLGSLMTIVTPSPETRFALPLVLFGIAGCAALAGGRTGRAWIAGAVIAAVAVFALGTLGLSHPAAPGGASPSLCAAR